MADQALRLAENLTLPKKDDPSEQELVPFAKVQVIVLRVNMSCSHCRQRISNLISKMNVLLDYVVDFGKNEVTVRGITDSKHHISSAHKKHGRNCFRGV